MNRIVKKHYPASKLPEDLREGLETGENVQVTVTIEEEREPLTHEQLEAMLLEARRHAKGVSTEEAVARIRELRDEWDD
ncbi:hypothetical protein [Microbaculum marinisediminis]|uniref:Uncharacterized protein n=1 Tax=Microbaculum marinisediminis TaxID=2931392 RepID=A0AAW5QSJ1_9HYPH|nr:hypothetical protein [Microbaculum sp. A6E488]MCT8970847.1 hypothetical protein [Microbaculum sp. A6E488]